MSVARGKRELTGWHVLAMMVAFFSVVIAVNLTMAFFARSSWTGLIVDNVHVAGQQFNGKAAEGRAQAALGWKPELAIADGRLSYRLVDAQGRTVPATQAAASFRRPVYDSDDHEVTLTRQLDGSLAAPVDLRDGIWIVEIRTEAGLERPYRDVRRLHLSGGAIQ